MSKLKIPIAVVGIILVVCSLLLAAYIGISGLKYYKVAVGYKDLSDLSYELSYAVFTGEGGYENREGFISSLLSERESESAFPISTRINPVTALYRNTAGIDGAREQKGETVSNEIGVSAVSGSYILNEYYVKNKVLTLSDGRYMNCSLRYKEGDTVEIMATDGLGLSVGDPCVLALSGKEDGQDVYISCTVVGTVKKGLIMPCLYKMSDETKITIRLMYDILYEDETVYLPELDFLTCDRESDNLFIAAYNVLDGNGIKGSDPYDIGISNLIKKYSGLNPAIGATVGNMTDIYSFLYGSNYGLDSLFFDTPIDLSDFSGFVCLSFFPCLLSLFVLIRIVIFIRSKPKKGFVLKSVLSVLLCALITAFPFMLSFTLTSDLITYKKIVNNMDLSFFADGGTDKKYLAFFGSERGKNFKSFVSELSGQEAFVSSFAFENSVADRLYTGNENPAFSVVNEHDLKFSVKVKNAREEMADSFVIYDYYAEADLLRLTAGEYPDFGKNYRTGDILEIVVTDGLGLSVGDTCFLTLSALNENEEPVYTKCTVTGIAKKGVFIPYDKQIFARMRSANNVKLKYNTLFLNERVYTPSLKGYYTYNSNLIDHAETDHIKENALLMTMLVTKKTQDSAFLNLISELKRKYNALDMENDDIAPFSKSYNFRGMNYMGAYTENRYRYPDGSLTVNTVYLFSIILFLSLSLILCLLTAHRVYRLLKTKEEKSLSLFETELDEGYGDL